MVSIILRKPPYGTIDAHEAIRHAIGGVVEDMVVNLILVDGGVNAARKGQNVVDTEYLSIEEGIRDCIKRGVKVYAEMSSLKAEYIESDELLEGVVTANSFEIADIVRESNVVMIF